MVFVELTHQEAGNLAKLMSQVLRILYAGRNNGGPEQIDALYDIACEIHDSWISDDPDYRRRVTRLYNKFQSAWNKEE